MITIAHEEWPTYRPDTLNALLSMPAFDARKRSGHVIHRGYRMDLDPVIGTADIFAGRFDPAAFVFGNAFEVEKEDRATVGQAILSVMSDSWVDDLLELELADNPRGLALGADTAAICLPGALIVEAGPWPIWRGDVESLQRQMDRHVRVFFSPNQSAHRKINTLKMCVEYMATMIEENSNLDRKDSRNRLKLPRMIMEAK